MFSKIIPHKSVEIWNIISISMSLTWQHHEIKSLISLYKGINYSECIPRMDIIINIAGYKQKVTFKVYCQILVFIYRSFKSNF